MVIRSVKSLVFIILQIICVVFLALSGNLLPDSIFLRLTMVFAGLIVIWSVVLANKNLNVAPDVIKNAKLIKSGPYRFIRHPMYLSLLIVSLCWIVDYFTLIRLLVTIVLFTIMILKMNHEEELLKEAFPEYEEYQLRTKRLIPFVY